MLNDRCRYCKYCKYYRNEKCNAPAKLERSNWVEDYSYCEKAILRMIKHEQAINKKIIVEETHE